MVFYNKLSTEDCSCDLCGNQGTEIHHIQNKGAGGSKCLDFIENLACLDRSCHTLCHDDPKTNIKLKLIILDKVKEQIKLDGILKRL
tara:strand:- start:258 stop:518 length:261 start_codon:yes stop_codon:yes gene_type:complete